MLNFIKSEKLRYIIQYILTRAIIVIAVVAGVTITIVMFDDSPLVNRAGILWGLFQLLVISTASIGCFYYYRRIQNKLSLSAIGFVSFVLASIYTSLSWIANAPHLYLEDSLFSALLTILFWGFALFFFFFVFYFARRYGSKNIFLNIGIPLLFYEIVFVLGIFYAIITQSSNAGLSALWLSFFYSILIAIYFMLSVLVYFFWPIGFEPNLTEDSEEITKIKRRFRSILKISLVTPIVLWTFLLLIDALR